MILGRVFLTLALLEVEDYYRIESADQPAISPDGLSLVFTRRLLDEEGNRRRTELWLATVHQAEDRAAAKLRRIAFSGFDASEHEGGSLLKRQSPIHYVQNARTPTLFIHGESDFRVPIEQGEQMYTAFKKLRAPAKFIRYPDSYHGRWKPWNVVHLYHHELQWWDRCLRSP